MDKATAELSRQIGRGREARSPIEIPVPGWKDIFYRVFMSIMRDRILLTAAGVTFYFLLALVPTLNAFISIYGLFNDRANVIDHVDLLVGIVPPGGLDIIREQLLRLASQGNEALGLTLITSLAIAFWSAGAGIRAMFEAMNIAYQEQEKRQFFVVHALALLFTFAGAIAALLVVSTVVVVPLLLDLFAAEGSFEWLVRVSSYGAMLLVLLVGICALYRWGPSREKAKWHWITPGAFVAVVLLGVASFLFSWYLANFTDYGAAYGSLGALIGFLTWIWISVTLVIIGAQLNSEIEHQTAQDSTTGPELPLGERGAYMADSVGRVWPPDRRRLRTVTRPERDPVSLGMIALTMASVIVLSIVQRGRDR
ncbi:hypothetical protein VW29_13630 [Devosia limi DSM 17137]|uniref:Membrane protein n=1 Tax=Devosia limi DSM 17137 TaxID=1121477 RepID=A0A0F5LMY5_9HYPH|nr:YihY/virulence factor BrkB family protein [Devosia limi]KKB83726.1 hypothetical protein VW29_13630 [Devosia limi DSM 17137]SHE72601.1 membrane protein [Devosia limi DSM 17137]